MNGLSTAFSKNGHKDYLFVYSSLGGQPGMVDSGLSMTPRQQTLAKAHFPWVCGSVFAWFHGPKTWPFTAECPFLSLAKSMPY